eukprot:4753883-Karenia_brevis.AAC.1
MSVPTWTDVAMSSNLADRTPYRLLLDILGDRFTARRVRGHDMFSCPASPVHFDAINTTSSAT